MPKNQTTKKTNPTEIFLKSILKCETGQAATQLIENFHGKLDREMAQKLIEDGSGWLVTQNLEKFQGLDHKALAKELIKSDQGISVAENPERFGLNQAEFAALSYEAKP